jgi:sulfoxide reductase heme-binding subunit YedZ
VSLLVLYAAQEAWAIGHVATEIVLRFYLTIGFIALVGLAALAATSTDGAVRRMGGKAWQRLHRAVYVIALLGLIHYFLQAKLDVWEPTLMAGLFLWLMAWRGLDWAGLRPGRAPVLWTFVLGLGAGVLTFAGEAVYFALFMRVDLMLILDAMLTFDAGVRPGWYVLTAGLAVFLAAAARAPFVRPVRARARVA